MVRPVKMKLFATINLLSMALFVIGLHTDAQELRRSGFLGIVTVALTDEARKQLQLNETGILVQSVVDGGSAKDSGIQSNDIITQVNDDYRANRDAALKTVSYLPGHCHRFLKR